MKASRLDDSVGRAAHDVGAQMPESLYLFGAHSELLHNSDDDAFTHVCKPLNPNAIMEN
jgi:hypothetical protein